MADPNQAPGTAPARSITVTTASAFGLAGAVSIGAWVVACVQAGHLVTPGTEALAAMGACFAPIAHALYRGVLNRLNRWADAPAKA